MSKFHTLLGALFDHFLFVLRLIANMSSPIYEQYRCAAWKPNKAPEPPAPNPPVVKHEKELIMPNLQPEPLATMMSFQLMAIDVVNQMQTALHKCVSAAQSPPKMAGLEAFQKSPCYFFIDLRPPPTRPRFMEPREEEEVGPSPVSSPSDRNNNGSVAKAKPFQRQRSISECSEDSFICFEEEEEDDDGDDDKDDEPEVDEDDSDDEDDSSVQFAACCEDEDDQEELETCECPSNDSSTAAKKVRFNLKPEVHVMLAWDFAYRAARKSEWQVIARDRARFQQRIQRVAHFLDPVLSPDHRDSVYRSRFSGTD
ncbi:hypothetical protein KR018_008590 [Drosophila ironensis]|nr:hypothetical protein KR018_008590 [Drosophila ironensis]